MASPYEIKAAEYFVRNLPCLHVCYWDVPIRDFLSRALGAEWVGVVRDVTNLTSIGVGTWYGRHGSPMEVLLHQNWQAWYFLRAAGHSSLMYFSDISRLGIERVGSWAVMTSPPNHTTSFILFLLFVGCSSSSSLRPGMTFCYLQFSFCPTPRIHSHQIENPFLAEQPQNEEKKNEDLVHPVPTDKAESRRESHL